MKKKPVPSSDDAVHYWLMKSEPSVYSIDHLKAKPDRIDRWDGIRSYQARDLMRRIMKKGDLAFFYHSSCPVPGVVGLMRIFTEAYPDPTQFDPQSDYYDAKSNNERPHWYAVDVQWCADFPRCVSLEMMKASSTLKGLQALQKGVQRLSVQPVEKKHFDIICHMGGLDITTL